jgi:hypothetical protein
MNATFTTANHKKTSDISLFSSKKLARLNGVFKDTRGYFTKATTPCVVAYDYARIDRLVRLRSGLYRFPVAEKQRSGLVART